MNHNENMEIIIKNIYYNNNLKDLKNCYNYKKGQLDIEKVTELITFQIIKGYKLKLELE